MKWEGFRQTKALRSFPARVDKFGGLFQFEAFSNRPPDPDFPGYLTSSGIDDIELVVVQAEADVAEVDGMAVFHCHEVHDSRSREGVWMWGDSTRFFAPRRGVWHAAPVSNVDARVQSKSQRIYGLPMRIVAACACITVC